MTKLDRSSTVTRSKTVRVVFFALLLDLLSFTLILPLLPRLLDHYRIQEGSVDNSLLGWTLQRANDLRLFLGAGDTYRGRAVDVVLLGGGLGSLFSLLQYLVSPTIGRLADVHGRRRILLLSMVGNIISCGIWVIARSFRLFLLARVVGGLSEGNVQLSMAIITDVTDSSSRSRGLAMVGIAFAVAFTTGPALGAYMASIDLRDIFPWMMEWGLNPYSAPAMISLLLVSLEAIYLYLYLPETLPAQKPFQKKVQAEDPSSHSTLSRIHTAYFSFLLLFSGMEFTLTFLTFDAHGFTHGQQGALLCYMGILSALLQGGYVRRVAGKRVSERSLALQGIVSCTLGLLALALSASTSLGGARWLWVGVTGVSVASATVVNAFNALASASSSSAKGPAQDGEEKTGEVLGKIRSTGQLGRAFGPLLACGLYWSLGPIVCYTLGAILMALVGRYVHQRLPERVHLKQA
ncbi:major facilitator superfamily domain-containing protein [Piptocephalis cylindrospora]|uniref:Major facilitator superfamily domain-containing protein n=1 Tax=Piptocephalis cylindrospora TaxID=1907219 RepID=A0A4P9Y669_9FUNG|nr:major facilitator superfamily domain-containing protein [Piptocephalis cylindrospora]|eukprot:RKP14224.1 major facilitator superfamily domain-containing protein [Piptocephalis cylindrospora]